MIDLTDIRRRTERWRAKHRASLLGSPSPLTQAHRDRDILLREVDRLWHLERDLERAAYEAKVAEIRALAADEMVCHACGGTGRRKDSP